MTCTGYGQIRTATVDDIFYVYPTLELACSSADISTFLVDGVLDASKIKDISGIPTVCINNAETVVPYAMSYIFVVDTGDVYIADETGKFIKQ